MCKYKICHFLAVLRHFYSKIDKLHTMQQKEREIEKECAKIARRLGWCAWKNEKNGNTGIPDHSFLHPSGAFFMVEFKKDEHQQLRPEQKHWLEHFQNSIFVCTSIDDFVEVIQTQNRKIVEKL